MRRLPHPIRACRCARTCGAEPTRSPVKAYNDSKIWSECDAWTLTADTDLELTTVPPTSCKAPTENTGPRGVGRDRSPPPHRRTARHREQRMGRCRRPRHRGIAPNCPDNAGRRQRTVYLLRPLHVGATDGGDPPPVTSGRAEEGARQVMPTCSSRTSPRRWPCCASSSAPTRASTAAKHGMSPDGTLDRRSRRPSPPPAHSLPGPHDDLRGSDHCG